MNRLRVLATACPWTSDPNRFDPLADAVQEASIHADYQHPGGAQ